MAKVYVKIPKTGLGNMLLVWAHGAVFARMNNLEVVTSSWWGFRWGALLRREKRNRMYMNYFKETGFVERNLFKLKLLFGNVITDPAIKPDGQYNQEEKIFLFKKAVRENDLFRSLRDHKALIKEEILTILNPRLRQELPKYQDPVVSVHIRRGDFKISNQATPLSYFINAIALIRKNTASEIPVTVFSDADPSELSEILKLPAVELAEEKADILDILVMSKSKILVLSKDSTFSYWAAFLSDGLVIMKHDDWQAGIRETGENSRELKLNDNDIESRNSIGKMINNFNICNWGGT